MRLHTGVYGHCKRVCTESHTGESNLRQRRAGTTLHQSYIPIQVIKSRAEVYFTVHVRCRFMFEEDGEEIKLNEHKARKCKRKLPGSGESVHISNCILTYFRLYLKLYSDLLQAVFKAVSDLLQAVFKAVF